MGGPQQEGAKEGVFVARMKKRRTRRRGGGGKKHLYEKGDDEGKRGPYWHPQRPFSKTGNKNHSTDVQNFS